MKRLLVAMLLGLVAFALPPTVVEADAPCVPPPLGFKWATMPIEYALDGTIPSDVVREALRDWRTLTVRFEENPASKHIIGDAKLSNREEARATMIVKDGIVSGFSIVVDTSRLNRSAVVRTLSHEFGHVLGLDHPSCVDSIMHSPILAVNLTEGDLQARDALYPIHRAYLPMLSK